MKKKQKIMKQVN